MRGHRYQRALVQSPYVVISANGAATHVMVPIKEYLAAFAGPESGSGFIPQGVLDRILDGCSPLRAWREHKRLTQAEMARRMGVARPVYARMENSEDPNIAALQKAAAALGLDLPQLAELYEDFLASDPEGAR